MELFLTKTQNQITVTCDGQFSHTSDLPEILSDPIQLGARLFQVLFPENTCARAAWNARPSRIQIVTDSTELDGIPWEYLYGPDGFVVLDVALVRGLPMNECQPTFDLTGIPLHIIAIPSNPISHSLMSLDIDGEWQRLKESLDGLNTAVTLERVRPPTLEQARRLVVNQQGRVIHFMGHGGHNDKDSFLVFENDGGGVKNVNAQEFIRRFEDTAFLVVLNACVSAAPGETEFSNLARSLVRRGIPYALGMRFPIPDKDAKAFARIFYDELARGTSVENALRQARNSLVESKHSWALGIPVLYTSLSGPVRGFDTPTGIPRIDEHQPPMELFDLPRAEGIFQGRVDELLSLGEILTNEPRAKLATVHGAGGQGKTALAREATERFAHAWQGGVWSISLENLPSCNQFVLELARFLKIDLDNVYKQISRTYPNLERDELSNRVQQELERHILHILSNRRTLLVLDNAEIFVEAVNAKNKEAIDLAVFLREQILSTQASLLVTSRDHLGWTGELLLELGGLNPEEGARLFWQGAPNRNEAIGPEAQEISRKVGGHPLSLRLLGGAFNSIDLNLKAFVHEMYEVLLLAEDKYKHENHRHRTLFASIETSVQYLDDAQKRVLSALWIFKSPFVPEIASQILNGRSESAAEDTRVSDILYSLTQRGLLSSEIETLSDGDILVLRVQPQVRLFSQRYLEQYYSEANLHLQMSKIYYVLLQEIDDHFDQTTWPSFLALRLGEDLQACDTWLDDDMKALYETRMGRVSYRIGDRQNGLLWLERALEKVQGNNFSLEAEILNGIANTYQSIGECNKAIRVFNLALELARVIGNPVSEATILMNVGMAYAAIGQPTKALEFGHQALPLMRANGNNRGEAQILNNMAHVYALIGQTDQALKLFEQALPLAQALDDKRLEGRILNNMGEVCRNTGKYLLALEFFNKALQQKHLVGDQEGEAGTLNNMGVTYTSIGQPKKALELFEQALQIGYSIGDRKAEADIMNNIAALYRGSGQLGSALQFFEKAVDVSRAINDQRGEAVTLSNMGVVYRAIGDPAKAMELYERALPLARAVGDQGTEASTLRHMGSICHDTNKPDMALQLYEQSLLIERVIGDRDGEADALTDIAGWYFDDDQLEKALDIYEQVLTISRETNNFSQESLALNNLAALSQSMGEPAIALNFLEKALSIRQAVNDRLGEVTTLCNLAVVLYAKLSRPKEAIAYMESGVAIMYKLGLKQDESGVTLTQMVSALERMKLSQPMFS